MVVVIGIGIVIVIVIVAEDAPVRAYRKLYLSMLRFRHNDKGYNQRVIA